MKGSEAFRRRVYAPVTKGKSVLSRVFLDGDLVRTRDLMSNVSTGLRPDWWSTQR